MENEALKNIIINIISNSNLCSIFYFNEKYCCSNILNMKSILHTNYSSQSQQCWFCENVNLLLSKGNEFILRLCWKTKKQLECKKWEKARESEIKEWSVRSFIKIISKLCCWFLCSYWNFKKNSLYICHSLTVSEVLGPTLPEIKKNHEDNFYDP